MFNYILAGRHLCACLSASRIGHIRGTGIFRFPENRKVAVIRGSGILEYRGNPKVATVRDRDILEHPPNSEMSNSKIGTLDEVAKQIRDAGGGASLAAFWWLFVR